MRKRKLTIAWLVLLGVVAAAGVWPLARMVSRVATRTGLLQVLADGRTWTLLGRTAGLAAAVAVLATSLGTALGYRLGARRWRGKTIARTMLLVPIAIPPYLHAVGWTTLLRPDGAVAGIVARLLGMTPVEVASAFTGFGGALVVMTAAYFPIAALFAEKSLAWMSPSLVEAARVCGAGRWQTLCVAYWPALRPAVVSSAMIVFLLASSDLGVPTLLKIRVFNTEVFTQLSAFHDTAAAVMLALPLVALGLLVVRIERGITVGDAAPIDASELDMPRPAGRAETFTNWAIFAACGAVLLVLPLGAVMMLGADAHALRSMAGLALRPAGNSLRYGLATAVAATTLALALASLLRGTARWRQDLSDAVVVTGFAIPSTILALALLGCYGLPATAGAIAPESLVIAALTARYLIVAFRIVGGALARVPDELFEAAALAGARWWPCARHVVLPLLRPALLAAGGATFVLSLAEVGSTILLYPPGGETLLITLLSIEANSPRACVGALTLMQVVPVVVAVIGVAGAVAWLRPARRRAPAPR